MKPLRALLAAWASGGLGAVIGSILGRALGHSGLFIGAIAGGIVAVAIAARLLVTVKWLPASSYRGALVGGLLGFAVAIPIAVANLGTPLVPIASGALIGVGLLFGAGATKRSGVP